MVYLTVPMFMGLVAMMTSSGLIMYAIYHDCDPLSAGIITRRDQVTLSHTSQLGMQGPGNHLTHHNQGCRDQEIPCHTSQSAIQEPGYTLSLITIRDTGIR